MMVGTEDADRAADLKPPLSSNERLEGLSKLALPLQVNNSIVVGFPSATTSFAEELVTRKHGAGNPIRHQPVGLSTSGILKSGALRKAV